VDNDAVTAAVNCDDPDVTVDVQPPAPTPSNNRTLSASNNKTLAAAEAEPHYQSLTEDQQQADDTRDVTTDVADGEMLFSIHLGYSLGTL